MYLQASLSTLHLSHDYVYVRRMQGDGESDLVRLARTLNREVAWFYDPSANIWYNAPAEQVKRYDNRGRLEIGLEVKPCSFPVAGERLVEYHTHTKKDIDEILASELAEILPEAENIVALRQLARKARFVLHQMPSALDLSRWIKALADIEGSGISMSFAVAAPYGITYALMSPRYSGEQTTQRFDHLLDLAIKEAIPTIDRESIGNSIKLMTSILNRNDLGLHVEFAEHN